MEVLGQRLDRIEDKLDKLADAMVTMARAEEKLDKIREACEINTKVDWDWAELSPNEEFKRQEEMLDE